MTICFDREICGKSDLASKLEWLETNGLGGFASSTIIGLNTRRYHGLLTAATKPPVGRVLLLSKLEETLIVNGNQYDLSSNQYPGKIHPDGHRYMSEFRLTPFPVFTWKVGDVTIEKTVFMVHGENTTVVEYALQRADGAGMEDCSIEIRPLIAFRDFHSTTHENGVLSPFFETFPGLVSVTPYASLPKLFFAHNAAEIRHSGFWYRRFQYQAERARGLDSEEDLFCPFVLRFGAGTATIIASTEAHDAASAPDLRDNEIRRRLALAVSSSDKEPVVRELTAAADHFIVKRGDWQTIIAGYHWFSDWGRDTMIALPGLTLATGRFEVAKNILRAFAASVDEGMLPNRFPDGGEAPEYNNADGTLWFFEAIRAYSHYSGDLAFVREQLYDVLKNILNSHLGGTRYGIHVDSDGLLACGLPGTQLTWMDARIGDRPVTPRVGKPVEIQALWYNALRAVQEFAKLFGDTDTEIFCREMADLAKASFNRQFWNDKGGCLYDVVNGENRDASIRPNQIFSVSLHHPLLSSEKALQVVNVVRRELLVPIGVRTLSPRDLQYRPGYSGDPSHRDSAYHQGTVWPWLMGPFITAWIKANKSAPEARAEAANWIHGFEPHLRGAGLGFISEVADAETPHAPEGCIAQAWSVAELLRAAVEDVWVAGSLA